MKALVFGTIKVRRPINGKLQSVESPVSEYSEGMTDYFKKDEPFIVTDQEGDRLIATGYFVEAEMPTVDSEESLKKANKSVLVEKAAALGVENPDSLKKDELVEAILTKQNPIKDEIQKIGEEEGIESSELGTEITGENGISIDDKKIEIEEKETSVR